MTFVIIHDGELENTNSVSEAKYTSVIKVKKMPLYYRKKSIFCYLFARRISPFPFCRSCGAEKRKCAFMQNRPARCPLTSSESQSVDHGPVWLADPANNGERSQLGSHGS